MEVVTTRADLARWRAAQTGRVGLVPTMGSLHAGHARLIEAARAADDVVAASVFVNPTQFGPDEDFDAYPRDFEADRRLLAAASVDMVFAPATPEMYPRGSEAATYVGLPGLTDILCARHRPGHFTGVATIVAMLFNAVRPDAAYFGEKDYQQLAVIRRMAEDLCTGVAVVGVAIEREADGLARSSRNAYLDRDERRRAVALPRALAAVGAELDAGSRAFDELVARGWQRLVGAGFAPDYFEIRRPDLAPAEPGDREFRVLAAGWLGRARLIDNLAAGPGASRGR